MELLWKNASPTSEFEAQTVQLSPILSADDIIMITGHSRNTGNIACSAFGKVGERADLQCFIYATDASGVITARTRCCTINSNGISFGDAYAKGTNVTTSGTISNDSAIPIEIYRIKGVSV